MYQKSRAVEFFVFFSRHSSTFLYILYIISLSLQSHTTQLYSFKSLTLFSLSLYLSYISSTFKLVFNTIQQLRKKKRNPSSMLYNHQKLYYLWLVCNNNHHHLRELTIIIYYYSTVISQNSLYLNSYSIYLHTNAHMKFRSSKCNPAPWESFIYYCRKLFVSTLSTEQNP